MTRSGLTERLCSELSYFDPDIVFERSRDEEVCPFEVSLELLEAADVVVCDYNYVFDPYIGLRSFKDEDSWDDCVFIVDEAHNLLDRARGYYSPEIDDAMLQRVTMHLSARHFAIPDGWEDLIEELRDHFQDLARPLEEHRDATQILCEPDDQLLMRQRLEWERLVLRYVAWKIENKVAEEEDPVIDFYYTLVRLTDVLGKDGDEFARIIEKRAEGYALKIFCLDPSKLIGEIVESSWATIAMSATLEPFEFHRKTLGFPSDRIAELSLPSPFPRGNRRIVVMTDVDTTYKSRAQHYDRIAERIGQIAESMSGNVLALFPSYAFLREISMRSAWIGRRVFIQQPDMTEYERKTILDALTTPDDPCLVLAVSGGMYAEGIDYAGEMLSAVCIVGPSLPAVTFEQELLKRYFDEQYAAGFEYAYLIPGMTRVVQSAGRVIRSERDIGVIALLCRRFASPMYTRYFPADWYENSPRELVAKNAPELIRKFFEEKSSPQLRLL
jgi:DNA excision repair protein ERCC-2